MIEGVVQSLAQKRQLLQALSGIPYIKADLKTEKELSADKTDGLFGVPSAENVKPSATKPHSVIEQQLSQFFKTQEAVEAFSEQAFEATESLMAHAWALKHLSDRYANIKATSESNLRPSSQTLVEIMLRDHHNGMLADVMTLSNLLEPPLLSFTEKPPAEGQALPLFDRADRIERLTFYLLFGADITGAEAPKDAIGEDRDKPTAAARDLLLELQHLRSQIQAQNEQQELHVALP